MQKSNVAQLEVSANPHHRGKSIITAHAGSSFQAIKKTGAELDYQLNLVNVSRSLAINMHIPARSYLVYHTAPDSIYLGPIIGILNSALRPEGRPGPYEVKIYREMIRYARKRGVFIYLFRAGGVDKRKGLVEGVTLDQAGNWLTRVFPRPDIVYNRIRKRSVETSSQVDAVLKNFHNDPRLHLFNSRFLYKWEVYQAVGDVPVVYSLFPFTMQFTRHNLEIMMEKFGEVIIKPDSGSLGKGIVKIISKKNRIELAESSEPSRWFQCSSIHELYSTLSNKMNVDSKCLLQRLVTMSRYKGRIFDIRAQFQKDGTGTWVTTGAAVRAASKRQFVTHIPNGGKAEVFNTVVRSVFPDPGIRKGIRDQLDFICNQVPATLEQRLDLNLAIVSMDIAIDPQGKMWILEVNSKPSHFDEKDIRRRHMQLFIDYCVYAAAELRKKSTERSSL